MGPRLLGRSEVTAECSLCSLDCPVREGGEIEMGGRAGGGGGQGSR